MKTREPHKIYCDYQIKKAKSLCLVASSRKPKGFENANVSKAVLARQLASLF